MKPRRHASRIASIAAAAAALASCSTFAPFAPDLTARAPRLDGYGTSDIVISTRSPQARALFNAGVLQAYAFNEKEAVRMFKAALAQDPDCVMCAWGVAWQLGPNINDSSHEGYAEALKYVGYALTRAATSPPRERALVESLALRYAHPSTARETAPLLAPTCGKPAADGDTDKVDPLDAAYADRMRALADASPDDPDIASLYAEAEIIATPGDTGWTPDGKPVGRIGEATARVEKLLARYPDHTGLNHYMVHLADALPVASRATAAADRLGALAPKSPHLVHMPAHIYVHLGRYADAMRVNETAVANDAALAADEKAQDFSVSKDWRLHNQHFLWYAAVMAGREDDALAAARALGERVASWDNPFAEFVRSMPLITLVRFQRWDDVMKEPRATGDKGMSQAWYDYARGVAAARLGRLDEAQAALERVTAANKSLGGDLTKILGRHLQAAQEGLAAEVALARGANDEALLHQAAMVKAAAKDDAREPPALADGTKVTLGDMQLRAGKAKDAEATFREVLVQHPKSGWALRGLARALDAQGRAADAKAAREELSRSWTGASTRLLGA